MSYLQYEAWLALEKKAQALQGLSMDNMGAQYPNASAFRWLTEDHWEASYGEEISPNWDPFN